VIRAIRSRAEARRAAAVERLLRRLPDLTDRERALVEQLSSQLVAAILHEPSAVLRDDRAGSLAATARRLFRIG
jgi:glutamyl-tRNA reductase